MTTLSRLRSRTVAVAHATAIGAAVAAVGSVAVAPAADAADRGVAVADNAYDPGEVEVNVGDTVTWLWVGEGRHSVSAPGTFDSHPQCTSLTPAQCGTTGDRFSFSPTAPGTIEYRCRIHTDMVGRLTVREAPSPEPSSPPPSPSPTASTSPTASPSPSPSPEPTTPSPAPSRTPTPSGTPSPSRTPVGPPASPSAQPVPTITPTATPSATASPAVSPSIELTPFPSTIPLPEEDDVVDDDVVAVDAPGGSGGDDTPVRVVAAGIVGATVLAFGRFVLFAPPWR